MPSSPEFTIQQPPPLLATLRPIVSIGAGGIVADAHLPAYKLANFEVVSIFDLNEAKARDVAARFDIPRVCASLEKSVSSAPMDAVFDLALPASANVATLEKLPDGAAVLIQKPMGENLEQAREIVAIC